MREAVVTNPQARAAVRLRTYLRTYLRATRASFWDLHELHMDTLKWPNYVRYAGRWASKAASTLPHARACSALDA
jgi:hypothetical protein